MYIQHVHTIYIIIYNYQSNVMTNLPYKRILFFIAAFRLAVKSIRKRNEAMLKHAATKDKLKLKRMITTTTATTDIG